MAGARPAMTMNEANVDKSTKASYATFGQIAEAAAISGG